MPTPSPSPDADTKPHNPFTNALRWLCVLPGAIAAGFVFLSAIHLGLSYWENRELAATVERTVTGAAIFYGTITASAKIAPAYKVQTAKVLFALCILLIIGAVMQTVAPHAGMRGSIFVSRFFVAVALAVSAGLMAVRQFSQPAKPKTTE